ncbi:MAG: hypothetical protein AAFV29_20445, partial [Myxococcota bacterium]
MVEKAGRSPDVSLRTWPTNEATTTSTPESAPSSNVPSDAVSSFERNPTASPSAILNGGVRTAALLPGLLPDRPEAARATIQNHNLAGSVRAHALNQLEQRGKIRI